MCEIGLKLWLRSCPDLLMIPYIKRNTRENIWNISRTYIYGIYKRYIRNIHEHLWYEIIRNTGAAFGGAPMGRPPSAAAPLDLCFWICVDLGSEWTTRRCEIFRNRDPLGRSPKAAAPLGRRRRQRLCFWSFYIINIYGYSLYIPYRFHISVLNMFHIFSFVCFLIYGVKSSFGHEQMTNFR